jgi:hypothetical protein
MRDLRDGLAELDRSTSRGPRVARHSAVWWVHKAPLLAERERADHLDLLGTSCLALTRMAIAARQPDQVRLAPAFRELGHAFAQLAKDPGDGATRQAAAEAALVVTRRFEHEDESPGSFAAAVVSLRLVAADLLLFAGVTDEEIEQSREREPT